MKKIILIGIFINLIGCTPKGGQDPIPKTSAEVMAVNARSDLKDYFNESFNEWRNLISEANTYHEKSLSFKKSYTYHMSSKEFAKLRHESATFYYFADTALDYISNIQDLENNCHQLVDSDILKMKNWGIGWTWEEKDEAVSKECPYVLNLFETRGIKLKNDLGLLEKKFRNINEYSRNMSKLFLEPFIVSKGVKNDLNFWIFSPEAFDNPTKMDSIKKNMDFFINKYSKEYEVEENYTRKNLLNLRIHHGIKLVIREVKDISKWSHSSKIQTKASEILRYLQEKEIENIDKTKNLMTEYFNNFLNAYETSDDPERKAKMITYLHESLWVGLFEAEEYPHNEKSLELLTFFKEKVQKIDNKFNSMIKHQVDYHKRFREAKTIEEKQIVYDNHVHQSDHVIKFLRLVKDFSLTEKGRERIELLIDKFYGYAY